MSATTTSLTESEMATPFFSLPAETRLHIYSYLIPTTGLEIDLCTPRRPDQSEFVLRKRSVISNLLNQVLNLDVITRTNGLHLLLVSQRTRAEVFPLLAKTVVRFHCPRCFEDLLRNLSFGLGVGVTWMKHVEIVVDLMQTRQVAHGQMLTRQLARLMATEAMYTCKKTAWLFYGRLDLTDREKWKCEPLVEKRRNSNDSSRDAIDNDAITNGILPQTQPNMPLIQGQGNYHDSAPSHQKWLLSGWFDV